MLSRVKKKCALWSGFDNVDEAFAALGEPADMSIVSYLHDKRVVVKNDPALARVFGQDVVDRYEEMLSRADR